MTGRIGGWIQTFTGRAFWPLDPRTEDIVIEDVAHALSNMCRYTGHTRVFYSVANHAVLASHACAPEDALEGLLHDASEAYLVDVPRPIKHYMVLYKDVEARLEVVIAERFDLRYPWPPSVKTADNALLATERRDLMAPPPMPWRPEETVDPLKEHIDPWPPAIAERLFLERFHELVQQRGLH